MARQTTREALRERSPRDDGGRTEPRPPQLPPGAAAREEDERRRIATVYFPAKQYFDFCQWVILATAFGGISLYFLDRPVFAFQYAACLAAALAVTAIAFWHVLKALHVYVEASVARLLRRRRDAPPRALVLTLAAGLDAIILAGFIHMLQLFSRNILLEMGLWTN